MLPANTSDIDHAVQKMVRQLLDRLHVAQNLSGRPLPDKDKHPIKTWMAHHADRAETLLAYWPQISEFSEGAELFFTLLRQHRPDLMKRAILMLAPHSSTQTHLSDNDEWWISSDGDGGEDELMRTKGQSLARVAVHLPLDLDPELVLTFHEMAAELDTEEQCLVNDGLMQACLKTALGHDLPKSGTDDSENMGDLRALDLLLERGAAQWMYGTPLFENTIWYRSPIYLWATTVMSKEKHYNSWDGWRDPQQERHMNHAVFVFEHLLAAGCCPRNIQRPDTKKRFSHTKMEVVLNLSLELDFPETDPRQGLAHTLIDVLVRAGAHWRWGESPMGIDQSRREKLAAHPAVVWAELNDVAQAAIAHRQAEHIMERRAL